MGSFKKDGKLFSAINVIFNEKIPFNKILGLKVESIGYDCVKILIEIYLDVKIRRYYFFYSDFKE